MIGEEMMKGRIIESAIRSLVKVAAFRYFALKPAANVSRASPRPIHIIKGFATDSPVFPQSTRLKLVDPHFVRVTQLVGSTEPFLISDTDRESLTRGRHICCYRF